MDDARQRRQLCLNARQQAGHVMAVGDVGGDRAHFATLRCQRINALPCRLTGFAPTRQDQMLGTAAGQIPRDLQSDGAQSTGHQIGCVTADFQWLSAR
ncbi:Uncharacterised protein [Mycobacteroides abscessus subsp. abscessus]|nr:Uncharacterised protein [Mycobacteroides abscessus subsp. abscessus]